MRLSSSSSRTRLGITAALLTAITCAYAAPVQNSDESLKRTILEQREDIRGIYRGFFDSDVCGTRAPWSTVCNAGGLLSYGELSALTTQIRSVRSGANGTALPGFSIDGKPAGRLIILAILPLFEDPLDVHDLAEGLMEEWHSRTCNDVVGPNCTNSVVMVLDPEHKSIGFAAADYNTTLAMQGPLDEVKAHTRMHLDSWGDDSMSSALSEAVLEISRILDPSTVENYRELRPNVPRQSDDTSNFWLVFIWFYFIITSGVDTGGRRTAVQQRRAMR